MGRSEDTVAGDVLLSCHQKILCLLRGRFRKFIEGRYEGELPFLSRVRKKDLVAYKNSTIQEGGIKNETRQTARLHFSGAKSFLLPFAEARVMFPGMCDFSGIKAPTTMCNSNTKNALTPDQVACLFQVCRFFPESHERLLVLLYHGALRVNEATHIRIKDLKLEGQCFKVKVDAAFAKRSKERTIKLTEWATAQLWSSGESIATRRSSSWSKSHRKHATSGCEIWQGKPERSTPALCQRR